jgi:hypothetical protein
VDSSDASTLYVPMASVRSQAVASAMVRAETGPDVKVGHPTRGMVRLLHRRVRCYIYHTVGPR